MVRKMRRLNVDSNRKKIKKERRDERRLKFAVRERENVAR